MSITSVVEIIESYYIPSNLMSQLKDQIAELHPEMGLAESRFVELSADDFYDGALSDFDSKTLKGFVDLLSRKLSAKYEISNTIVVAGTAVYGPNFWSALKSQNRFLKSGWRVPLLVLPEHPMGVSELEKALVEIIEESHEMYERQKHGEGTQADVKEDFNLERKRKGGFSYITIKVDPSERGKVFGMFRHKKRKYEIYLGYPGERICAGEVIAELRKEKKPFSVIYESNKKRG
jgi:hypothetical protein